MQSIRRSPGEQVFNLVNIFFLCVVCFITLYPFWYVLILSLNDGRDTALGGIYFLPRKFTLANYQYVLAQRALRTAYVNTILRTVIGSTLCLMVSGLAAYSMTKKNLPGRNAVLTYFMIPMFIGGTIVSAYVITAKLGLLDNFLVYVVPGAFNFFYMIIIRTFMQGIPVSLEESAKIDGSSYYRIFFQIILPLCMPGRGHDPALLGRHLLARLLHEPPVRERAEADGGPVPALQCRPRQPSERAHHPAGPRDGTVVAAAAEREPAHG